MHARQVLYHRVASSATECIFLLVDYNVFLCLSILDLCGGAFKILMCVLIPDQLHQSFVAWKYLIFDYIEIFESRKTF